MIGETRSAIDVKSDAALNGEDAERRLELREKRNQPDWAELELAATRLEPAHIQELTHES